MILVAPNQNGRHLALHRLAPPALADALHAFLWEINAHWALVSLPLVCQNLKEMFEIVEQTGKFNLKERKLQSWPEVIGWIFDNRDDLAKEIGGHFGSGFGAKGQHPLMGFGIERHAVYATMCNSHEDNDWNEAYRLLQFQLLLAQVELTRRYTTLEEYEADSGEQALLAKRASPYNAAFAVRLLSQSVHTDMLGALPEAQPPTEFLDALARVGDVGDDTKRLVALKVFLEKAFGKRKQTPRIGEGEGSSEPRPRVNGGITVFEPLCVTFDGDLDDAGDEHARQGRHSTTTRAIHTAAEETDELYDVDDYPGEDEEDEEEDLTEFEDPMFKLDPGSFREVSAAQAIQIQMSNQLFPWAYGSLTAAEVGPIVVQANDRISGLTREKVLTRKTMNELEVLVLAQVMFWTSSSMERARDLKILGNMTTSRSVALSLIPKALDGKVKWRIRAPLPAYSRPEQAPPAGMDRKRTEFLELPDLAKVGSAVLKLMEQKALAFKESAGQPVKLSSHPFRQTLTWYRRRLKELLQKTEPNVRMTEHQFSRFMFTRILQASRGDLSATAIITGIKLPLVKVKMSYACPSVYRLQEIYSNAVVRADAEMRTTKAGEALPLHGFFVHPNETYIGNRICPTKDAVRIAIGKLRNEISNLCRPSSYKELIRYHDVFTLYTLWMFSYTTGVRGIKTPYLPLSNIDTAGRLVALSDKDSASGYKTRLARLTPTLVKQMKLYDKFIRCSRHIYKAKQMPCFFVNEKDRTTEVRPRELTRLLEEFLPFPVNIHRRFVSSELLDMGCPPEIVSAWMGHWYRGEEPWGKVSSFSYGDYCAVLENYLDPLLEYLGFRPIAGYSPIKKVV